MGCRRREVGIAMSRLRKWHWAVWREDGRIVPFPTLEAAEKYGRRYVGALNDDGFSSRATICHDFHQVAEVRMSGDGRVWTDVLDCDLA